MVSGLEDVHIYVLIIVFCVFGIAKYYIKNTNMKRMWQEVYNIVIYEHSCFHYKFMFWMKLELADLTHYWPGNFSRNLCLWLVICYVSEYWNTHVSKRSGNKRHVSMSLISKFLIINNLSSSCPVQNGPPQITNPWKGIQMLYNHGTERGFCNFLWVIVHDTFWDHTCRYFLVYLTCWH